MKRTILASLGLVAGSLLLSGCLRAPVVPPVGFVYTDYKAPLDFDQEGLPVGMKEGRSETMAVLGIVAMGDGSIKTAAQNGGISEVHGADYKYFNVLGIYQTYTTIVHGE